MISVYVKGVGLCAPGMQDWIGGAAVLRGEQMPDHEASKPAASILPPAERRRCGPATRHALQVAQEATIQAGLGATEAAVVFASSDADGENLHHILESLAEPGHEVSPTRFHNSVHNAAAGYWNIATGARTPANSLAAYDDSFAAGLVEAAVQASAENIPVLLVAFDLPFPTPLHEARAIATPFALALLLTPDGGDGVLAHLNIALEAPQPESWMDDGTLETLRTGNPAGRALPLLQAIATSQARRIALAWGNNGVVIEVADK
jgi:hypothetical protein